MPHCVRESRRAWREPQYLSCPSVRRPFCRQTRSLCWMTGSWREKEPMKSCCRAVKCTGRSMNPSLERRKNDEPERNDSKSVELYQTIYIFPYLFAGAGGGDGGADVICADPHRAGRRLYHCSWRCGF